MKSDYQDVVKGIQEGHKRFATGVYALWYPVVLRQQIKHMLKDLEATGIRNILQIELAVRPDSDQRGMTASGMIVINPPWKLKAQMEELLPWLHQKLVPAGTGHWRDANRAGISATPQISQNREPVRWPETPTGTLPVAFPDPVTNSAS